MSSSPIPTDFENWPPAAQQAYLASQTRDQKLELLDALVGKLNDNLDQWPQLIEEGLEARLPHDKPSQEAAASLLARVRLL